MDALLNVAKKRMNPKQVAWMEDMRANLDTLHEQWYGRSFANCDQTLFADTDRQIREAAKRLGIEVQDVAEASMQSEGWDGELYGPFVVLGDTLRAIQQQFANKLLKNKQGFTHHGEQFGSFSVVVKFDGHYRFGVEDTTNGVVYMVGDSIAAAIEMARDKDKASKTFGGDSFREDLELRYSPRMRGFYYDVTR